MRVVPLTIRFGTEELVDREELSTKEFWDRVTTGPDMPETAAPSPGTFQETFLAAAEAGHDGRAVRDDLVAPVGHVPGGEHRGHRRGRPRSRSRWSTR